MKMEFSEKKNIGVIYLGGEVQINFTSDDPVQWIMASAKVRSKDGYIERITDFVPVSSFKSSLKRDIKKHIKKSDLNKVSNAIKKHIKKGVLTQKGVEGIAKEL